MKTAGMICGLGPETTVDYYREILKEYLGSDLRKFLYASQSGTQNPLLQPSSPGLDLK